MKTQNHSPEKHNLHEVGKAQQNTASKNVKDEKSEKDYTKNPRSETSQRSGQSERESDAPVRKTGKSELNSDFEVGSKGAKAKHK